MASITEFFSDVATSSLNFYDSINGFIFEGGLTSWVASVIAYCYAIAQKFSLFMFKASLQAAVIIINDIVTELNLDSQIEGYWTAIDIEYINLMVFFHLPLILTMSTR
jgi:hypothetical protein